MATRTVGDWNEGSKWKVVRDIRRRRGCAANAAIWR